MRAAPVVATMSQHDELDTIDLLTAKFEISGDELSGDEGQAHVGVLNAVAPPVIKAEHDDFDDPDDDHRLRNAL